VAVVGREKIEITPELLKFLLPQVIDLAKLAGKVILEASEQDYKIVAKHDNTPVTCADLAANKSIVDGVGGLTYQFPILSEESADISFTERQQWGTYWLVDPLDGTKEFIKKSGEYSVNIALVHRHSPVLGVIYSPSQDLLYYAIKGGGAFQVSGQSNPENINVCAHRRSPLIITCGNNPPGQSFERFIEKVGEHHLLSMGSSIKSCLVAEGRADIYARLGPTSEWDTAAAQCIVEEAGGCLTDLNLEPLCYNTKDSLLNPHFLVFGDKTENWKKYL